MRKRCIFELVFLVLYLGATLVHAECEGDLNDDGKINESDLLSLASELGRIDCNREVDCLADVNGDEDVDGSDCAIVFSDYGRSDCPLIRLTRHPADDGSPAWSPDNSKIAFTSARSGTSSIWVMKIDGTGKLQLTDNLGHDAQPHWSSDSSKSLFVRPEAGIGIYGSWIPMDQI